MKKFLSVILVVALILSLSACGGTKSGDKTGDNVGSNDSTTTDYTSIAMPNREIKGESKELTYYHWLEMDKSDPRSYPALLESELGIKLKPVLGAHLGYWDTLATMVASGNSPDLVAMPNWNCIPVPMLNELVQPLDDLIDFDAPLWADTKEYNKYVQWDGKNYMGVLTAYINGWVFYNKQMFEDYGVTTPKEYYEEDNWTWDTFKTVSDSFVSKKSDGTIDTYGVAIYNNSFQASTGVELVERDEKAGYKLNLKSEPITKMMNFLYSMGKGGSNSLVVDSTTPGIDMFAQSKVAMCVVNNWALTQAAWADLFANDKIDWICLPKMDKESSYYNELALSPTFGIASGSKNPKTAALAIEYHKWLNVGSPISSYIPSPENAATKKYKITFDTTSKKLTKEQIDWTKELIAHPTVSIMWQSWLCQNGTVGAYPGINDVLLGKKWSEVVEVVYPSIDGMLKSNF